VIKTIEVEGLTRLKKEELIDLICFHVGDILDREELRRGIRRAFKKGIFLDIQVVSEPCKDGIKLKYIVKEIPFIKNIKIEGNNIISAGEIRKNFTFKKGEKFREEFLEDARSELISFYHRKGFPNARIKISVVNEKTPGTVSIYIHIDEGHPLIIKHITAPADVKDYMRVSTGDIFDREKIEREIKRLEDYYKAKGYIRPVIGPYKFRDGELIIPVKLGQRLVISFEKNEAISAKKLLKELPFIEEGEVNDELIEEAVDRITGLYLSKGYYYVRVAAGIERKKNVIKVTFFIFEGKKVTLKRVTFKGTSISHETLKKIIPLEEGKPFNKNLLDTSKEALVRFYNALGYLHMNVAEVRKEFKKDGRELFLTFIIDEGPQTKIKAIKISGNKAIATSEIRNVLQLKEETPYNMVDIGDARYRILALYKRYGYTDARVDARSTIKGNKAFLTFKIIEGKPSIIGKIIIRGNYKTKEKIIRREFTFKEGDPYNYEEISKTKQRLYKLGLFDEISIEMLEPVTRGKGNVLVRDMLVSLKEGNAGSVEFSLGYGDYEQFRGSLDISYRNLGGYNREVGFRGEMSSVERRYIFNFREPWLFNKPKLPFKAFLIKENKRVVNIDTREVLYKIDRLTLLMGVERELTPHLKASLNYEYSFVDTKDVKPGVILSKEDTGTLAIGSISPSLFYDTRNNPLEPTSGSLNGIVLKFASKLFLSETEFIKGTFQSSWFYQLKRGVVLALSFRGGAAYSFEDTAELPLIERFFLGGGTTVRGYSQDMLGPKGTDNVPTGGNIFALVNGEFRFSLGKGFGLVTFVDGGNVWRVAREVEPVLKYTAGAGLRYSTPVGPLRIDYGYKLKRQPGESVGEIHFSFGHAF